jgi:N-acetyltransferase
MIPTDLTLETSRVLLRPLIEDDFEALLQLSQDEDMWYYFTFNLADPGQLQKWMNQMITDRVHNTRRPFTIIDKSSNRIAGSMSLMNISMHDLRTEIGASWLGKDFRSSGINKHAKFTMMRYAFEVMQWERVEFKTDELNLRARKGLQNVGGIEEGVLRSHMTMWNNRRRSSVYYSVLKNEWPKLLETIFKDIA